MRELDLLLEKFLAFEFDTLDDSELAALERLLNYPDQDILAWLTSYREPPQEFDAIVARMQSSQDWKSAGI